MLLLPDKQHTRSRKGATVEVGLDGKRAKREVLFGRRVHGVEHGHVVRVAEQQVPLEHILVERVDIVARRRRRAVPRAGLRVNVLRKQVFRRTRLEECEQRAARGRLKAPIARQPTERAEFEQKGAGARSGHDRRLSYWHSDEAQVRVGKMRRTQM